MTAKKEHDFRQDIIMVLLFILLILFLGVGCIYFYWQNSESQKLAKSNDAAITNIIKSLRASVNAQKFNLSDPTNSTIENTKVASVNLSEKKVAVLDKNNKEVSLLVTSNSKIQEVLIAEGKAEKWIDVSIADVLKDASTTVIHNKNHEVVYMVIMVNK